MIGQWDRQIRWVNKPTVLQVTVWHRTGHKPLSAPIRKLFADAHICVDRLIQLNVKYHYAYSKIDTNMCLCMH